MRGLALAVLLLVSAGAASAVPSPSHRDLPGPTCCTPVVTDGSAVYLLGLYDPHGAGDARVWRLDPASDTLEAVGVLPYVPFGASAVWADGAAYIFGGSQDNVHPTSAILRFDPATGVTVRLPARLPEALLWTAAASDGPAVYVFGGLRETPLHSADPFASNVTRYDLATGAVSVLPGIPLAGGAAVWDGATIHLLGGYAGPAARQPIRHFAPASATFSTSSVSLPAPAHLTATFDGTSIHIFGGGAPEPSRVVYRYDPWLDTLSILDADARAALAASAVNIGGFSYVVGGNGASPGAGSSSVVRYRTLGEPSMPVPEATSLLLVGAGVALVALVARRR